MMDVQMFIKPQKGAWNLLSTWQSESDITGNHSLTHNNVFFILRSKTEILSHLSEYWHLLVTYWIVLFDAQFFLHSQRIPCRKHWNSVTMATGMWLTHSNQGW